MRAALAMVLVVAGLALTSAPAAAHSPHDAIIHVVTSPDFASDNTVFVISENRIMRSTNGGESWQEILRGISPNPHLRFAIAPSDKNVMYLSTRGAGVLKSTDQGLSWARTSATSENTSLSAIAVSPQSPDTVFAAGARERPVPDDRRRRAVDQGPRSVRPGHRVDDGERRRSRDRRRRAGADLVLGRRWRPMDGVDGHPGCLCRHRRSDHRASSRPTDAGDSGDQDQVFAGTDAATMLLRSDDGGASFTTVGDGLPAGPVNSIKVVPGADDEVWVSMWHGGAYRSTDGGDTFERSGNGLKTNHQAADVGVADYRHLAIATGGRDDDDGDGATVMLHGRLRRLVPLRRRRCELA